MPALDPSHWLYRLGADDWLAAAAVELSGATAAFARHADRVAITHCRRAAGMALNALLWKTERPGWGRSYMEHVAALAADDPAIPADVRAAAEHLRATPPAPPKLLQIARRDQITPAAQQLLAATRVIIDWATAGANQDSRNG